MTLLKPLDDSTARHAPLGEPGGARAPHLPHSRRGRLLLAVLASLGLLIWAAFITPQVVALTPHAASFTLMTTRWFSGAFSGGSQTSGLALGSVVTPQVCSSDNTSAVGKNLVVPVDAWVCGDALAVGGNVDVRGRVQGSAQAIGGSVTISGEVDGDVTAVGGDIVVQPGAQTHGALNAVGGHVIVAPGAVTQMPAPSETQPGFGGFTTTTSFHPFAPEYSSFWLGLLFWVSASLGLIAFVPEAVGHVRYTIARRFLLSGFSGALIGIVGVVLAAALFLTCLGIPVTLGIALAMWLAWVVGTVAFASWLGASLLRGTRRDHDPSLLFSTLLGVAILSLLKMAPVVGPVVSLIVGCVGLGAAILTLISARRVSYARLRW